MQAVKFKFVQSDRPNATARSDGNAALAPCPGQPADILANYLEMLAESALFIQDKPSLRRIVTASRGRRGPVRIRGVGAIAQGTSGAKHAPNARGGAQAPSRGRAIHGTSTAFLAAQLRRASFEKSRALFLLPLSLVRPGPLRSDIYARYPSFARRHTRALAENPGVAR